MNKKLTKIIKNIIFKSPLKNNYNFTYHTQRYKIDDILTAILFILKRGLCWRDYTQIYWNTIYKHFRKLSSLNIFASTYKQLLKKYFKKTPNKKLRIIMTDTTFIANKNGSDKCRRNKYMKNKKVMKVSLITDLYGIPIYVDTFSGNIHDSKILFEQLDRKPLYEQTIKRYFLADKGYDSKKIKNKLANIGFVPLIAQNKRNIKNTKKIKKMNKFNKKLYKRRINIEMFFGLLKRSFKRLSQRYDKYSINYDSFLYFALCCIVIQKI